MYSALSSPEPSKRFMCVSVSYPMEFLMGESAGSRGWAGDLPKAWLALAGPT